MSRQTHLTDPLSVAWLNHQADEHTPPNTISRRAATLRSVGNAGTASRDDIEEWWRLRRDKSPATRSNDLATLRSFYRWCRRWEHRGDDPTARLDAPKAPRGLPRPMTRHEIQHLLTPGTLPPDLRRAAALGAYAGLRISETARLRWSDIDTDSRRIHVTRSKGGRSRTVTVSRVLIDLLGPDTGGSVVTGTGLDVAPDVLRRRLNRAMRASGIDATSHRLRHTYGTLAYQATRDLVAVGRQLGHSSVVTTSVYAAAADETADRIAEAVTLG